MLKPSPCAGLLVSLTLFSLGSGQARAQTQNEAPLEEVTVTGQVPPGAVLGDIPPENSLNMRDIRAYGVGTVSELLDELALMTTSGQGRGDESPVILVNGRRISGINEVGDLPTEAILRLDILPEEVALKYGYTAEQKVVNVILRRRFAALTGEASAGSSTEGHGERDAVDTTLTRIQENKRLNVALRAQAQDSITEAQRAVVPAIQGPAGDPAYRTLQPSTQNYSANLVFAAPLGNTVSASTNFTAAQTLSHSLNGLAPAIAGGPTSMQASPDPLEQLTQSTTLHFGTTINADLASSWRLSLTGAYDHASTRTDTDRASQATVASPVVDHARSVSDTGNTSLLATRKLFRLPAGALLLSLQGGVQASRIGSQTLDAQPTPEETLGRTSVNGQVSLDVPITKRMAWGGAIGTLTVNVNSSATRISDFGTLATFGYGLNWSPVPAVSVIAAINEDRRAPSLLQLNSPTVTIENASVYDYATGRSVLATSISGGNPLLNADNRRTFKLGATVKPYADHDFTLTGNFSESRTYNAIQSLQGVSAPIEAAFPDRFVRDEDGQLIEFDIRPVNVAAANRSSLRWGFNLTQILREPRRPQFGPRQRDAQQQPSPPTANGASSPQGVAPQNGGNSTASGSDTKQTVDEVVVSGQRPQNNEGPAAPGTGRSPGGFGGRRGGTFGGDGPPAAGGGFAGGGRAGPFGRGPGFSGGDDGARLQLSVYHTWLFRNEVTLRSAVPPINLLGGGTLGGPPPSRHLVQVNSGIVDNGIGLRLTGEWRSAGRVIDAATQDGDLRFDSLATVNLRVFADLGQRFGSKKWARGLRATLAMQNLFDTRQRVVDSTGAVPPAYQPGYLDPVGRSVLLTIRKIL